APTTVSELALEWGFTHLGRFSAEYRRRFQELPSETLRR
ncbi:MAG: helix-turn-helix domain-containing protein, partial [Alphaproteobacteria bacterium]